MVKSKVIATIAFSLGMLFFGYAQNPGDTIIVNSLDYSSTTRDIIVNFPTGNTSYEKIYMLYNMRCKNGQISTGQDRNKGCGEWDYSCNTYIHDSSHVDSIIQSHPSHIVSGFTGTTYNYVSVPTYNYYQKVQTSVVVDSTISDTASTIGTGSLGLDHVFHTDTHSGKSQYLFTGAELITAGVVAGNIDALTINVSNNPGNAKFFRLKIKESAKTVLTETMPDLDGFTEVYYHNTMFVSGANKIQFNTPFNWNGTSNLIVEFSFTNGSNAAAIEVTGNNLGSGLLSYGDVEFGFNGSNYIESDTYKGIPADSNRTVEAWVKTTETLDEIIGWGSNAVGQKWLVRLDGAGKLRTEVNSGFAVGTTVINDGKWHHVAVVLDGSNTTDIKLYVDGQLEVISNVGSRVINTGSSINVRVSKGFHNNYWLGNIAEVRVWSKALSASDINIWMHKHVSNSHPTYSDLELYYPLADDGSTMIKDASVNGRDASIENGTYWTKITGENHFKNLMTTTERPNLDFHQGVYGLTISNDTIVDSVMQFSNTVNQYQIYSKSGTGKSDSIGLVSVNNYWEATSETLYDPNGMVISSTPITSTGTINITQLPYYSRTPTKFEIMSFVTPYGIGLDFGMDGHTWLFDLTDFAPILNGDKRLTVERGGQWQEEMDIKFMFIVGTPPRDVLDIQQIWKVDYKSYNAINADDFFEPRDVMMDANGVGFKIRSVITGHGQEGEFIPREHYINLDGGTQEFKWDVWKKCAFNPVFPQGGTWVYDRAGWCPGMASDLQEYDITSMVTPGQTTEIDYGITTASGTSNYIVNNQLVTYGAANFSLDAAVEEIITPTDRIEYSKTGSICTGPVVKIKNTGSTTLTSLTFSYWINNTSTPTTYTWNGSLDFLESEEVSLPIKTSFWNGVMGSNDKFNVEISSPNNGTDGYVHNNKMSSNFEIPDVLPSEFYIQLTTNKAPHENSYKIYDEWNNVVLSRGNFSSETTYKDTVDLGNGCYTLVLDDTGNNGLSWWANPSAGSGSIMFRNSTTNLIVKSFGGDFGAELRYRFTVNFPLTYEELHPITEVAVYPNPAQEIFTVEMPFSDDVDITVVNSMGQTMELDVVKQDNRHTFNASNLSEGVYYIQIRSENKTEIKKVVIL